MQRVSFIMKLKQYIYFYYNLINAENKEAKKYE
jgi:hypothetical protein